MFNPYATIPGTDAPIMISPQEVANGLFNESTWVYLAVMLFVLVIGVSLVMVKPRV